MDVLQASSCIVGRYDAEQRAEPVVPCSRQVSDSQCPRDQCLLKAEPQDDMRGIGHLVGVHAYEATLDTSPQPRQVGRLIRRGIATERLVQLRTQPAQEAVGAA